MRLFVQVTRSHIRNGKHCDACMCPVALGVHDALVKLGFAGPRVVAIPQLITLNYNSQQGEMEFNCTTPRSVKRFILSFDDNPDEPHKPFSFFLTF